MTSDSLIALTNKVIHFRDARNWHQFHNSKDMALALITEVAELLELMQWKNGDELIHHLAQKRPEVRGELADIFYCLLIIAHDLQIDLAEALTDKMEVNIAQYPVEKFYNSSKKYSDPESDQ